MWKKFFIAVGVLIAVVVVVGLLMPTEYELERSILINAGTEKIHPLVGDLKRWEEWTPWKEADPTVAVTFGDKTTGVGASQTWTEENGDGELVFTASDPQTGIEFDMAFNQGSMKSKCAIRYAKEGTGTRVTWEMAGDAEVPIIGALFAALIDDMVGPMFESGLEKLKAQAEKEP